jgi:hypothetical protein
MSLTNSTLRRTVAIALFSAFGSVLAFSAGAKVGAKLDHGVHNVMIARMPVPSVAAPTDLQEEAAPPTEVARK